MGTYTEPMLTTDTLHQLCSKYNMQSAAIMLPLGKCLKCIYGKTIHSEKSFLPLLYLDFSPYKYMKNG